MSDRNQHPTDEERRRRKAAGKCECCNGDPFPEPNDYCWCPLAGEEAETLNKLKQIFTLQSRNKTLTEELSLSTKAHDMALGIAEKERRNERFRADAADLISKTYKSKLAAAQKEIERLEDFEIDKLNGDAWVERARNAEKEVKKLQRFRDSTCAKCVMLEQELKESQAREAALQASLEECRKAVGLYLKGGIGVSVLADAISKPPSRAALDAAIAEAVMKAMPECASPGICRDREGIEKPFEHDDGATCVAWYNAKGGI